jgi:hypothetical protein
MTFSQTANIEMTLQKSTLLQYLPSVNLLSVVRPNVTAPNNIAGGEQI